MKETDFKKIVMKKIKNDYPGAWIYTPNDRIRSGIPDILILYRGCLIAFELKIDNRKTTYSQKVNLKEIKENEGISMVARKLRNGDVKIEYI